MDYSKIARDYISGMLNQTPEERARERDEFYASLEPGYRKPNGVTMYYDRQGKQLTADEWASRYEDMSVRRVAQTKLANGYLVSTVWLGLDHEFGDGPPLIFETMVFGANPDGEVTNWGDLECERYSTEQEAYNGHQALVDKWTMMPQGLGFDEHVDEDEDDA